MIEQIGPYRVVEQIGVGGMGEVYKAFDDRLDRWVAIKRIRDDKELGGENRERFQREARATAKLNHSAIVHLYDIFRDGENDCIVMEYVEGMTLDKLIRNGPLEAVQAASLGHEIASGLAEAHIKGIIHRDLKVENVIVTPDGHAKILDFGLARPMLTGDLDASLTGKGQLVGTSRAMSPEYVGGEDIDHRSDLFSLGVLLYEAVTSHSPFKAHNTLATLKQVMLHRQTPAHMVNADVPEDFSSVIENLLEKDPEDRPKDAREVARDLGHLSGKLSSGDVARPSLPPTFTATPTEVLSPSATSIDLWPRRRWFAILAILLAAGVAGTYLLTRWWVAAPEVLPIEGMTGDPGLRAKDRIVLADFQNLTGEPLLDDSVELAFRLGLEQSQHAYVLPSPQVRSALLRMERDAETAVDREVGMEIGQREGARALVIGAIGKIGETYTVTAEVVDPKSGVATFSTQENASNQDAILTVLATVTEAIRIHLGESLAAIEETLRPLERATTKDLEALHAYSLGVAKIAANQLQEAIQLLELAIEIDPGFAMAYAKLATVYIGLDFDDAKILDTLGQALSFSDRLTEFEKLYVQGWAARLHGEPDRMLSTWSLMSALYPEEYTGHFNLGVSSQIYLEDYEAAAAAFERAVGVADSESPPLALTLLGYCRIALEQYDEARSSFEKLNGEERLVALSDLYLATRSYPELQAALKELTSSPLRPLQIQGRLRSAQYYADLGDLQRALSEARLADDLAADETLARLRLISGLTVAALQKYQGAESELRETLTTVVATAKELMSLEQGKVDLSPVRELALAGKLAARSGDIEKAVALDALIAPLVQETPIAAWRGHALMLQGEILAAQGEGAAAIARLEDAFAAIDTFQIHESLAHHYEVAGRLEAAIAENEWLKRHRGRALVDCINRCNAINFLDWSTAVYRLGVLHERSSDLEAAAVHYRRVLDQWSEAGDQIFRQDAEQRLKALGTAE